MRGPLESSAGDITERFAEPLCSGLKVRICHLRIVAPTPALQGFLGATTVTTDATRTALSAHFCMWDHVPWGPGPINVNALLVQAVTAREN
jgi:hypothetical protein